MEATANVSAPDDPPRRPLVAAGLVTIDPSSRRAWVDGRLVPPLSNLEFQLLLHLADDPTRVFTVSELLRDVWGYKADGVSRTVSTHSIRLRRKLESAGGSGLVVTVWGQGYRLLDPPEEPPLAAPAPCPACGRRD